MTLEILATKYAALKGTSILASRLEGDVIIFVFVSGSKFTMTQAELEDAVSSSSRQAIGEITPKDKAPRTTAAPFEYIEEEVKEQNKTKNDALGAQRRKGKQ
jgi:hypothetical protein